MAPAKKGGEKKKGHSFTNKVVTKEYTTTFTSATMELCPSGTQIRKFVMKEMRIPDMCIDTRLNKAVWAKGIRNVPYFILVWLSRKHTEDKDSPNKLYMLVTYILVTTFKNPQTVNVSKN
ncbi:60S ribosomal protein L31-like [Rhinolophus ferrumequinum]|uniref:60S ribosomal protein L31-like n=1 Tax=Rhinolophus ferrumequinum TaxID=59479 RepID=UPI00140FD721|nr:60S ribosomal protein L31-like [Rhinolophus ferrumequinum]